ncbi:hypothetical protein ACH5RR_025896 [Cinchona calisaya]|uniref:EMB514 n=1 Tax=Cinchona calisaya TaxID=153742 RepID=A0ABD2Z0Y6_9GENT
MAEAETPLTLADPEVKEASIQDMEVEAQPDEIAADNSKGGGLKRAREEGAEDGDKIEEAKKMMADKSFEEERLGKTTEAGQEEEKKSGSEPEPEPESGPISLGPKTFKSSVEMYDYFYKFLHFWAPNVDVNKYERVMLLELLKKGHLEPVKKIGNGIRVFQVRYHPKFKSRCFFLTREDDSVDDFSFRKCVDHILPLPEDMLVKYNVNKALGGGRGDKEGESGRGGGRGPGCGRGRGGKWRN